MLWETLWPAYLTLLRRKGLQFLVSSHLYDGFSHSNQNFP